MIELRELERADGSSSAQPWLWIARYAFAGALGLGGLAITAFHLATVGTA